MRSTIKPNRAAAVAIAAALWPFAPIAGQGPAPGGQALSSPRLVRLRASVEAGDTAAEQSFWREVAGHVPLLEFIPPRNLGDGLVTFIWQGDDSTTAVTVDATLPPERGARSADGRRPLTRLQGTRVWYRTERLPFDFRLTYSFQATKRNAGHSTETADEADPLNPGPKLYGSSIAEGLLAPKQPWWTRRPGVPAGALHEDTLFSHELGQDRSVTVYTPARSARHKELGLVVMLDGEQYASELGMPETLDNLITKGMIQPATVVFVHSKQPYDRTGDYSCNPKFAQFLLKELIPWARRRYHNAATAAESVIGGSSLGGLQAACTAYWHPESFGNVLSLSGSFFYFQGWPSFEEGLSTQTGWLTQEIASHPRKALRFFISTGTFEGDGVPENRRLRDVVSAKGYRYSYLEFSGGHDQVNWRGIVAEGLIALLSSR